MRKNNETTNKYLAGLVDGDGCITLQWVPREGKGWKPSLYLSVSKGTVYPKTRPTLEWLMNHYRVGSINEDKSSNVLVWKVYGSKAESVINQIKKHLVVKGQHAQRMVDTWYAYKGSKWSDENLAPSNQESRDHTGSLKPKQKASPPWLAGFLDSDGHVGFRDRIKDGYTYKVCKISWNQNVRDIEALELIQRTFGGSLRYRPDDKIELAYSLGRSKKKFAERFLKPIVRHMRIKKWKAEQILAFHNAQKKPQRLNERTPVGEVIVQ